MRVSRVRLELAVWFGAALALVLGLLGAMLYGHLHRQAEGLLVEDLERGARGLAAAIRHELADHPSFTLLEAAQEEIDEFIVGREALVVYDGAGERLAARGAEPLLAALAAPLGSAATAVARPLALAGAPSARRVDLVDLGPPPFAVATASAGHAFEAYERVLGRWLGLALPVGSLVALGLGYVLAQRALAPLGTMTRAIDRVGPSALDLRLPVRGTGDELDALATRFNALLERLADAQRMNRRFLAQAAHQIRTPLTIVEGETSLALRLPRAPEEYHRVLERVGRAAEQMAHRVADLFLLAQAQAGDAPATDELVELDGLVLDCTDLMRERARVRQHRLELRRVEPVPARGSEQLLREALLELIENALKHADPATPIGISAYESHDVAALEVASAGGPVSALVEARRARELAGNGGLGLSILEWIAAIHRGRLEYEHHAGTNVYRLVWPRRAARSMTGR